MSSRAVTPLTPRLTPWRFSLWNRMFLGECPDAHTAWFLVLGSWFLVLGSWFLVRASCVFNSAVSR
ncbi:hypothetical protein D0A35_08105 [Xanthomonas campestris]|nr:hypothetical protein D0A35_08105 [Xanthomonas campestris]